VSFYMLRFIHKAVGNKLKQTVIKKIIYFRKMKKKLNSLIGAISKETDVEKSIIYHFIVSDLESIYRNKIAIHKLKLDSINKDFADLESLEKKLEKDISLITNKIVTLENEISTKTNSLQNQSEIIKEKQNKLIDVNQKLSLLKKESNSIDKDLKKGEYDIMMSKHKKSKSSSKNKFNTLIVTVCTIIGIIVALILILK